MGSNYRQREQLFKDFKGVCFYCEEAITFVNGTRDHFWPRSKQGWNGMINLVLACEPCNSAKADRLPTLEEFYKLCAIRPEFSVEAFHVPSLVRKQNVVPVRLAPVPTPTLHTTEQIRLTRNQRETARRARKLIREYGHKAFPMPFYLRKLRGTKIENPFGYKSQPDKSTTDRGFLLHSDVARALCFSRCVQAWSI